MSWRWNHFNLLYHFFNLLRGISCHLHRMDLFVFIFIFYFFFFFLWVLATWSSWPTQPLVCLPCSFPPSKPGSLILLCSVKVWCCAQRVREKEEKKSRCIPKQEKCVSACVCVCMLIYVWAFSHTHCVWLCVYIS